MSEPQESRDVIERIWITGDKILYDEASAQVWRDYGHTVEGPFVLEAEPLEGAS